MAGKRGSKTVAGAGDAGPGRGRGHYTPDERRAAVEAYRRSGLTQAVRGGHEMLARDAVWAQDGTFLARLPDGEGISGEAARDRGSMATVIVQAGPAATAEDLRDHLLRANRIAGACRSCGSPTAAPRT